VAVVVVVVDVDGLLGVGTRMFWVVSFGCCGEDVDEDEEAAGGGTLIAGYRRKVILLFRFKLLLFFALDCES
jgi:hypothetical protein